jgi:toxin ParE1/3/4
MAKVQLSRAARTDLIEIWTYLAAESERAADRVLDRIGAKLELLAQSPRLGRRRIELHPSLRSSSAGDYVVFYEVIGNSVMIARVLHCDHQHQSQFDRAIAVALSIRPNSVADIQRGTALRTIAVLQTRREGVASTRPWAVALTDSEDRAYALLGIAQALLQIDDVKLPYGAIQLH